MKRSSLVSAEFSRTLFRGSGFDLIKHLLVQVLATNYSSIHRSNALVAPNAEKMFGPEDALVWCAL